LSITNSAILNHHTLFKLKVDRRNSGNTVFRNEFMLENLFNEDFAVSLVGYPMGTEGTRQHLR